MVEALRNAEYRWVVMGVLAYGVVEAAAAFRWHVLLKVQQIRLRASRLAGLFFIGLFYNQFLPGGTGGDIIKSYYLLKETPDRKAGALLAVVFDRFIGLVALVAITATLITLRYDFLSQKPETRNLLWLLLINFGRAPITFLVATFVISGFKLFHFLPAHFPGRDKLIEIFAAYHLYAHHWRATLVAFGASIVAHLATFMTFLFAAYALGYGCRCSIFLRSCLLNERSPLCLSVSPELVCAKKFYRSCSVAFAAFRRRKPFSLGRLAS